MKLHQELKKPNYEGEYDPNALPKYIPIDPNKDLNLLKEWEFTYFGGRDNWRVPGTIKVFSNDVSMDFDFYLQATVNYPNEEIPFYSILSIVDQWGTFHNFKATHIRPEDRSLSFSQEWGNPSFLKALGEAMVYLAELSEPDPQEYINAFKKKDEN
jgi:hypothetical protein